MFFNKKCGFGNVAFLLGALLLFGCSDQIKQERVFSGVVKRASNAEVRENVRVSVFQDNGKEFPKNAIETANEIVEADGRYSLTINPFSNDEAGDVRLVAQVNQVNPYSGGFADFFYTIGNVIYPKNQVLEQEEGEPLTADLLTEDFGVLALGFTLAAGEIPRGWQANLRIYNQAFSHELQLSDNDFSTLFRFPVQAGEEFTIQMNGSKGGESIEVLETFTVNVPPGVDSEVTYRVTL